MNTDRNIQKNGLVNLLTLLSVTLAGVLVSKYSGSAAGLVAVFFLGMGSLVALVSYFQMRLEDREKVEKLEFEELQKSKSRSALFESQEAEVFPSRRAREQFERVFVPAFTVLLFALQGAAIYWLLGQLKEAAAPVAQKATVAMAFYSVFFLVLFLLGKYSASLARLEEQRLLRPGASFMLLGAFICLSAALAEAGAWFGFPHLDRIVAYVLVGLLGLIALETCFNLIFEIYRPRVKGQAARVLYESRLVGLLGQPGGLLTTAAQALDYQFGFKVSETWFYRFLERALAWIVLLQLGVLLASTTFVIIEPDEEALLERFGKPAGSRAELGPGLHFKFPWPIEKIYRYNPKKIQSISVGFVPKEDEHEENTILWTRSHYKEEFNLLVASREKGASTSPSESTEQAVPVNLLTVSIPVHFIIKDIKAWAYNHKEGAEMLEQIATREVVRYLVSVDIEDIMAAGRLTAAKVLQERIQARADQAKLGVKIVFLGLQDIHPPVSVADAYESVGGAIQEKEGRILAAEGYQAEVVPRAHANAAKAISEMEAYRLRTTAEAAANAGRFTNQIVAYKAAPAVYPQRVYLDTFSRAVTPARKYLLAATNTQDVVIMNLEDKVRPDLLDVPLPPPKAK